MAAKSNESQPPTALEASGPGSALAGMEIPGFLAFVSKLKHQSHGATAIPPPPKRAPYDPRPDPTPAESHDPRLYPPAQDPRLWPPAGTSPRDPRVFAAPTGPRPASDGPGRTSGGSQGSDDRASAAHGPARGPVAGLQNGAGAPAPTAARGYQAAAAGACALFMCRCIVAPLPRGRTRFGHRARAAQHAEESPFRPGNRLRAHDFGQGRMLRGFCSYGPTGFPTAAHPNWGWKGLRRGWVAGPGFGRAHVPMRKNVSGATGNRFEWNRLQWKTRDNRFCKKEIMGQTRMPRGDIPGWG